MPRFTDFRSAWSSPAVRTPFTQSIQPAGASRGQLLSSDSLSPLSLLHKLHRERDKLFHLARCVLVGASRTLRRSTRSRQERFASPLLVLLFSRCSLLTQGDMRYRVQLAFTHCTRLQH